MVKPAICIVLLLQSVFLSCQSPKQELEQDKPNVVIILADDFGVGDIQAHYPDNKIPTPYLDRLVQQGISFTDAHSASAVCTPTRYGLLTGRYSWRTRLQEWVLAAYEPSLIAEDRLTLPEFLRNNGYKTACVGKWHLGFDWPGPQPSRMVEARNSLWNDQWDFSGPIPGGPVDRGFDHYFGVNLPNQPPFTYMENDRVVEQPTASYQYDSTEGIVLPRQFEGCAMAPGWRMANILPEITDRAVNYIHDQAKSQEPFFLFFSMTSPHEPIVPSEKFRGASGIAPIADFVMETDWSAGQVIKAVDDAGLSDNTIVIFTADNGHSHYTGWEDLVAAGHQPSGPYRGHKGDIWEGGHRVPLVVRWPGRVASSAESSQLVCLNDIFATLADLLNQDLTENSAEDSFSFLGALINSDATDTRSSLISHSVDGEFAFRKGPWKLVYKLPEEDLRSSRGKETVVELYDLGEDVAEENNLATDNLDLVNQLSLELEAIVDRGTSRPGDAQANDTKVDFREVQLVRWTNPLAKN